MRATSNPLITRLGTSIREARINRGLSQIELAKRCGLTRLRIIGIEKGNPSISMDAYFKAAMGMGMELCLRPLQRPVFEELKDMFP